METENERTVRALEAINKAYSVVNAEYERQNKRLAEQERALSRQAELLQATLDNVHQGLLVLDGKLRVVLFNRRLADLFGFPPEVLQAGVHARELVAAAGRLGHYGERSVEQAGTGWMQRLSRREGSRHQQTLADGRILAVAYTPMADDGWVITYEDVTEVRRAGDALTEQNRLFTAALDTMSNGLCLFDPDLNVLIANRRYVELYGLSPEVVRPGVALRTIMEHSVALGNHPDTTAEDLYAGYRAKLEADGCLGVHRRLSDGRTIEILHQPMTGGGWVATYEDITERLAAGEYLAEQNRRFDAALSNMAEGLLLLDAQLNITVCNAQYRALLGLPPEVARSGAHLRDLIAHNVALGRHPGQSVEELYAERLALFAQGAPARILTRLEGDRVLETTYRPMAGGGWVATYADITERVRAEEALAEQRQRLDAALNNMAQGLCMFDAAFRIVIFNERFVDMLGFDRDAVRPGATLRMLFEHTVALGNLHGSADTHYDEYVQALATRGSLTMHRVLRDGRTIAINHRPMTGGGWVATYEDITEQKRNEARIAHMARHDALTNLPNRTLFREALEEALDRAEKGETFGVLCLDLDHFKAVNDTLGHPTGDALLRAVTARLQEALAGSGLLARLGGDEFAILLPALERPEAAATVARRLIEAVADPYELDGHQVVIGTSVGLAVAPSDGSDPDTLLKNADMALYRAKSEGRGTCHSFEPAMDARLQQRRTLELDLRKALALAQFELYYQPLVSVSSGEVSGFEALLRWRHPVRGLVGPADFIPLAEEIGLIVPLGEWVIARACAEAVTWPRDLKVAVNLSPAQFKSRNLVLAVAAALGKSGLSPQRLELEITESVLLADSEATLATLHQLRGMGVRIAMDDFGTGYSSLSYLRSFPFDKIKIDRSFVRELAERNDCLAIVRAVSGLGSSLGMVTTAEGVETEEQLRRVEAEGCTEVQGYYFSPPRPAGELGIFFNGRAAAAA
ncbi:MAG TPA: PAS-domain containing protein [Beijerinckiaceae bacterium]|jgi:diguanylate cyclase (GGDEF)-like protein